MLIACPIEQWKFMGYDLVGCLLRAAMSVMVNQLFFVKGCEQSIPDGGGGTDSVPPAILHVLCSATSLVSLNTSFSRSYKLSLPATFHVEDQPPALVRCVSQPLSLSEVSW